MFKKILFGVGGALMAWGLTWSLMMPKFAWFALVGMIFILIAMDKQTKGRLLSMNTAEHIALIEMNYCYEQMQTADTTAKRRRLFDRMLDLWNLHEAVRKVWNYVADAFKLANRFVKQAVQTIVKKRNGKYAQYVQYDCEVKEKTECAYMLYILSEATQELFASKVGTTKDIARRMSEEIKEYTASYGEQVVIKVVRFCEYESHAETIADESFFRAVLIWRYGKAFKDNDRFTSIHISLDEARELESLMAKIRKMCVKG